MRLACHPLQRKPDGLRDRSPLLIFVPPAQSKDDTIEQLQRQLAEAHAARERPASHAAAHPARAVPSAPIGHGVRTMEAGFFTPALRPLPGMVPPCRCAGDTGLEKDLNPVLKGSLHDPLDMRPLLSTQVPGVAIAIGGITLAVAAGTVYAASRRLLPQEQRSALDATTGLFALAAAAYVLQA